MTSAIRVVNLSKCFGKFQAVKNLHLEVATRQVYGFLGPNGAGKTTTIRMILDLIRPNQGDIFLFDKPVRRERAILGQVGAQVEDASFYPFLTGRRNLEVLALTANLPPNPKRIDELLELVNLTAHATRRVRGYSTGMKQRLGLAATLLSDPALIILDEPTNGLDPQGIQEMRFFIRRLVDDLGKTVFLSSHLLNEVEQVCDRVAIINRGELLREGAVSELVASTTHLYLEVASVETARHLLTPQWRILKQDAQSLSLQATREAVPEILETLINGGVKVYGATMQQQSLEEYFLAAVGGNHVAVISG